MFDPHGNRSTIGGIERVWWEKQWARVLGDAVATLKQDRLFHRPTDGPAAQQDFGDVKLRVERNTVASDGRDVPPLWARDPYDTGADDGA